MQREEIRGGVEWFGDGWFPIFLQRCRHFIESWKGGWYSTPTTHFVAFVIIYFEWSTWCWGRRKKDTRIKFFERYNQFTLSGALAVGEGYKKDIVLFLLLCFLHACMTIHLWLNNHVQLLVLIILIAVSWWKSYLGFVIIYWVEHLLQGKEIQIYETKATLSGGFMKVLCTLNKVSCHYFRWCDTSLIKREMK